MALAVEDVIRKLRPGAEVKIQRADGLRECRKLLTLARAGKLDGYLLEGMACPGGCIAGAGTIIAPEQAAKKLKEHIAQADVTSCADSPFRAELEK